MKEFLTYDLFGSAEWIGVDAIRVMITEETLEEISKAREILKSNTFINSILIGVGMSDVIQYRHGDEDGELEELPYEDYSHFRIGTEEIKVSRIDTYYVMHNKYTTDYIEIEIPE